MKLKIFTKIIQLYFRLPGWNRWGSNLFFWCPKNPKSQVIAQRPAKYKNICIFAHYDARNQIASYVLDYLKELQDNNFDIIFVSTCESLNYQLLLPYCHKIILRANRGLDFGSYKCGLRYIDYPERYQKLLLANDSMYGPLSSLTKIFSQMQQHKFWGLTTSYEFTQHVQSYFLVFDASVWQSDYFQRFWQRVRLLSYRIPIIVNYELGLSVYLRACGITSKSYIPDTLYQSSKKSPCHFHWQELLEIYQFPFLKLNILAYKQAPTIEQLKQVLSRFTTADKIQAIHYHCTKKAEILSS